MGVTVNKGDLGRLVGKLTTVAQKAPTHRWPFIVELLTNYGAAVMTAMGSVNGFGGDAKITLHGLDGYVKDEHQTWPALSPYTIAAKQGKQFTWAQRQELLDVYDVFADAVRIWLYTGASQGEVYDSVIAVQGTGSHFVGIEQHPYAAVVELGDPARHIPKRPLFTVLNDMLRVYIQRELRNPQSKLSKRIRNEFVQFARAEGWGNI